jgi:hypothetical protein
MANASGMPLAYEITHQPNLRGNRHNRCAQIVLRNPHRETRYRYHATTPLLLHPVKDAASLGFKKSHGHK